MNTPDKPSFNINNPICISCLNELYDFNNYNFKDIQIKLARQVYINFQINKDFICINKYGVFMIKSYLYESFYCECQECKEINILRISYLNTEPNYKPIKKLKRIINKEIKNASSGYYPHLAGLI